MKNKSYTPKKVIVTFFIDMINGDPNIERNIFESPWFFFSKENYAFIFNNPQKCVVFPISHLDFDLENFNFAENFSSGIFNEFMEDGEINTLVCICNTKFKNVIEKFFKKCHEVLLIIDDKAMNDSIYCFSGSNSEGQYVIFQPQTFGSIETRDSKKEKGEVKNTDRPDISDFNLSQN